jgi:hydroxymethylbilane synthase
LRLRIGSRGSQLALWQANYIAARLREGGHEIEIEIIHTTGDKITGIPLAKVGAKGMFTKEIEETLAARQIDLAVHSLKDLPTDLSPQFEIAVVAEREDPRDAFCSIKYSSIEELPTGARVGTSSLRREAQLKALCPSLVVYPMRGNVDTRLRKLQAEDYDAVILASAGLRRLGRTAVIRQLIPIEAMCPAAGQGALGIETRAGDETVRKAIAFLDDPGARIETACERVLLKRLGGGCQVPIGANAKWKDGQLHLEAVVASPDGTVVLRESVDGTDPARVGETAAERLLARGGAAILDQVYGRETAVPQQP